MSDHLPLARASLAQRTGEPSTAAPVRIVHIGLGAFHRSHQAWYTDRADPRGEWGIAAFTGRTSTAADDLLVQDGLYTLIERSSERDSISVIKSISEVWDGTRVDVLEQIVARRTTSIVTLTVTETGYGLLPDGTPDIANAVVASDLRILAGRAIEAREAPRSPLARLVCALRARRDGDGGPIAIVPCDNMPDNGALVARGVMAFAAVLDPELARWVESNVSFVSTSVDRITPRTTPEDLATVRARSGWEDRAPVVAEPFSDWVLAGEFPAGRPEWELAGARFVDDIEPFERRKLWLLNGAHSLLAFAGILRGHATIADAITDPRCRRWVGELWDEASHHLPSFLGADDYRAALLERFENHRIRHELEQVALEGASKLRFRIVPVALLERAAGRSASGCATAIAAWAVMLTTGNRPDDSAARAIDTIISGDPARVIPDLVGLLDARLGTDEDFVAEVLRAAATITATAPALG